MRGGFYKATRRVKWMYCRYCGAKLKRDPIGQLCPTQNCQWQHGLPESEDTKTKMPQKEKVVGL